MATRSTITLKTKEGNYKKVYCYYDGYPEHHLPILEEHYNTYEKVEALIELGDISVLAESIECPEGHCFETPVDGYTVFYGRDRGEEDTEPVNCFTYTNPEIGFMAYNYLFEDGKWECKHISELKNTNNYNN